jgi:hypothetical protein
MKFNPAVSSSRRKVRGAFLKSDSSSRRKILSAHLHKDLRSKYNVRRWRRAGRRSERDAGRALASRAETDLAPPASANFDVSTERLPAPARPAHSRCILSPCFPFHAARPPLQVRAVPVRKDDEVKIVRGTFEGREGKVTQV